MRRMKKTVINISGWNYPAEIFEEQTGFTGIAAKWKLPFTLRCRADCRDWDKDDEIQLWRILVKHNPELHELPAITYEQALYSHENGGLLRPGLMDHILGVCSQLNLDDIKAFLNPERTIAKARVDSLRNKQIEELTDHWPGWVLSEETYIHIMSQISSKTGRIVEYRANLQNIPIHTPEIVKIRQAIIDRRAL